MRFAQGCVFGGFSGPDTTCRDLETNVLQVIISVAEDQQLAIPDDVAHHFAGGDLVRHSFQSWPDGRISTSLEDRWCYEYVWAWCVAPLLSLLLSESASLARC